MILRFIVLSLVAFSLSTANDCVGATNFTLRCEADGPKQVINVRSHLNSTHELYQVLQNCDSHIVCNNGYNTRKRCSDDFSWTFDDLTDEIYCSAAVTYYFTNLNPRKVCDKICEFPVPTPDVSVAVVGDEIVGSSLSLQCNATVVKGINSSVDIIWMSGAKVLKKNNSLGSSLSNTRLLYTSHYNIPLLETSNHGTTYSCQVVINASPSVKNSDNCTLNATIPAPVVNVMALDNHDHTIGSPLSLECSATTVRGISGNVDIVWMKDDIEIPRVYNGTGKLTENGTLMLYTDNYTIPRLQMMNDNTTYHCQAKINANSLTSSSESYKYILNVTVPILTVNVTSINNLTINGPLMLRCKVTTVKSIGSSGEIVWITNGSDINRTRFDVYPENTTFTDNYTIPNLTKEDNGTKYQCYAMINATILVNATGNYTVVLKSQPDADTSTTTPIPSSKPFNKPDESDQTALVLALVVALVVVVITVSVALRFVGSFAYKHRRKLLVSTKKLNNSQDEQMNSSFMLDDTDYSIIGRDQPSTCEHLKKSNKSIYGWIDTSEFSQLDDKRGSMSSDYATVKEHEMLNYILGVDYETQHAASDSENYDQENSLNAFGNNTFNSNKSADYVYTCGEEDTSCDPRNNCDETLQKGVPPLLTHDNNADENSVVHTQCNDPANLALMSSSSTPTLSEIPCPIASLGIQDATIMSQNSTNNGTNEEIMQAPTSVMHTMPSTDHNDYFHYSNAVNKISLPVAVIEGDYVDYSANGEHSEYLPTNSQPIRPVPLEDFKDGSCYSSTHDINAIPQFESIIINPEKIVYPASTDNEVKEGLYISINSGTTVHQSIDQNMHLDEDQVCCPEE